ncbi:MAG: PEP-CTERM sorting domain-containing protein [Cyanobacteria bacterium J06632_22]
MKLSSVLGLSSLTVLLSFATQPVQAALLVGNTEGNNIVEIDETTGAVLGEFISPFEGFESPDTLVYGPGGDLYISSGTTLDNSAIYRFDGHSGQLIDRFATGGGLLRPYGLAFGPDELLYVSSFRSDEILRYDGKTGAFVDVFAAGNGTQDGLLNGPNGLLFGPDGALYVTTQGSVADDAGGIEFLFESQVLKYDIATGTGEVFVPQPEPFPSSFGFVSFLGLAVGPEDGDLYVSDFANGLRRYDFNSGVEKAVYDTNYTQTLPSSNFIGSLAFGPDDDLYSVGFDFATEVDGVTNLGALLKFDPASGQRTVVASAVEALRRPIGLIFKSSKTGAAVPEPGALVGLAAVGLLGFGRRPQRQT